MVDLMHPSRSNMEGGQYQMFHEFSFPKKRIPYTRRGTKLMYLMLTVLILGVLLTMLNIYELHSMKMDHEKHHQDLVAIPKVEAKESDQTYPTSAAPIVWIQGHPKSKNNGPNGYLKHIYNVFNRIGFGVGEKISDWVVLWCHDYPFLTYADTMKKLKPYQKVNHFPGSGFITNKVSLAQTNMEFIPRAFELPNKKTQFLEYAAKNRHMRWVQKSNKHRGIEVKSADKLDFSKGGTFVQEYISNPFLIDGRKFDIGVYTIITSIDPLRVYFIDGDALFRFCPVEYYPFDESILDKYVVGDEYYPMWELPSLRGLYLDQGYTFKTSFNEHLTSKGKDPQQVWHKIQSAIRQVFFVKEIDLIRSVQSYPSKRNFFEMMRFDFVLDENLNVFLMEANMSPNLSSDHFSENARLYEHAIFNLLGLVGVQHYSSHPNKKNPAHEDPMLVSSKDIHVFPDFCMKPECKSQCNKIQCKLCESCLSKDLEIDLKLAYLEHMRRGSARRIFPPSISYSDASKWNPESTMLDDYPKLANKLMYLWFIGKCRLDKGWCH